MVCLKLVQWQRVGFDTKAFRRSRIGIRLIRLGSPFQPLFVELIVVRFQQGRHLMLEVTFIHPLVNGCFFDHQGIMQCNANRILRLRWGFHILQVLDSLFEVWKPFHLEMLTACQVERFVGYDRGTKIGLGGCVGNGCHGDFLASAFKRLVLFRFHVIKFYILV